MCPAHTDKAEIKCMSSAGGKTPTDPKSFVHYSLPLGTLNETESIYVFCSI